MLTRLRRALARRRRRSLPGRVARLARPDNLLRVLDEVVAGMRRPGLRGGAIFLVNERHELYFAAHRGLADAAVRDIRLPVGQGVVGGVAASGRAVVVDDLDVPPPGLVPTNRSTGSNALTRSMVAVPIHTQGGVLGVLEMGCGEPAAFDAEDVAVLEQVAAAMAGAVVLANPLKLADEVLQRRVRELTLLQEATRALNASLGLDSVVAAVVERAAAVMRTPYAALHRVVDGSVHNLARWGDGERLGGDVAVERALREGISFAGQGEARCVVLPAPPGEMPPLTDPRAPLRALAVVRLLPADGDQALLTVASADERGFDPAQQRLLEGFAHVAGLALANALRYRDLAEAAARDPLTGVLTRSAFEQRLAETWTPPLSLLAVDVDHLKEVNEAAGHEAGDAVVRDIAQALQRQLGADGVIGRSGGDEFVVLLPGADAGVAMSVAEELRRAVHSVPVLVQWLPRVSIGLATAQGVVDPRAAWDAAVEALQLAKGYGRDRVESLPAGPAHVGPTRAWEVLVAQLVVEGGVESVYQPLVRLADSHLVGYEALARPAGFAEEADVSGLFEAARSAGLHRDLDWVCRRAAVQVGPALPEGLPLFLNVGVWALMDPLHDVDQMLLLLRSAGLAPGSVVLELSEREAVHDLARLRTVMAAYRARGLRFSIDDVGEGHSTLDMLAAGAPDFVKIGRRLVAAADQPGPRAAVEAVVAFARSSGAAVVAEGVETAAEAARMRDFGVELGQGFWLGPPQRLANPVAAA